MTLNAHFVSLLTACVPVLALETDIYDFRFRSAMYDLWYNIGACGMLLHRSRYVV
jgi:hypothetical protein